MSELKQLCAENERLKQRCEWMRAAHMLAAQSALFFRADRQGPFVYYDADITVIDGEPALYVLCSDTFAYACADAERAEYADATELLRLGVTEGWPGLIRWIQSRRIARGKGDPADPIVPVKDMMLSMDTLRAERDSLRAALVEAREALERFAGAMDAAEEEQHTAAQKGYTVPMHPDADVSDAHPVTWSLLLEDFHKAREVYTRLATLLPADPAEPGARGKEEARG